MFRAAIIDSSISTGLLSFSHNSIDRQQSKRRASLSDSSPLACASCLMSYVGFEQARLRPTRRQSSVTRWKLVLQQGQPRPPCRSRPSTDRSELLLNSCPKIVLVFNAADGKTSNVATKAVAVCERGLQDSRLWRRRDVGKKLLRSKPASNLPQMEVRRRSPPARVWHAFRRALALHAHKVPKCHQKSEARTGGRASTAILQNLRARISMSSR